MKYWLFLFPFWISFAQESIEPSSENYFWASHLQFPQDGLIAAKNCYIRSEPNTKSSIIDSLQTGFPIQILEETKANLTLKGLDLPWILVSFVKNNQLQKGYLWKGFLAIGSCVFNDKRNFITSVERKYTKKVQEVDYQYERVFYDFKTKIYDSEARILAEKVFSHPVSENYYVTNSVIPNWGLQNVECVYRLAFNGESCGVPTEEHYLYWNGIQLDNLLTKSSMGDANMYYHTEAFIFPNEKGGIKNCIQKTITTAENTDENGESSEFLVTKSTEFYSWDGKKAVLTKTSKPKTSKEKWD